MPLLRWICQRSGIRLVTRNYEVGKKCVCVGARGLTATYPIAPTDVVDVLPLVKHAASGELQLCRACYCLTSDTIISHLRFFTSVWRVICPVLFQQFSGIIIACPSSWCQDQVWSCSWKLVDQQKWHPCFGLRTRSLSHVPTSFGLAASSANIQMSAVDRWVSYITLVFMLSPKSRATHIIGTTQKTSCRSFILFHTHLLHLSLVVQPLLITTRMSQTWLLHLPWSILRWQCLLTGLIQPKCSTPTWH